MIRDFGISCGIIALIFILLYSAQYVLRDLYSFSNSNTLKKTINNILPILAKCNSTFLLIAFILSLFHIASLYSIGPFFRSGYVVIFLILFIFKITFFPSKKSLYVYNINFLSYLLIISIIVHVMLR